MNDSLRLNSNQLIPDNEIKDVHVKKVIDISKVAKTNNYNDLDNIPKTFPPSEHISQHPIVNDNTNGMMDSESKKKMNKLKTFKFLRIKYDVEPQDVNKGYKSIDITIDINGFNFSDSNMSELEADIVKKIVTIIGSSLDPNIYKPVPGDPGDPGDPGPDGYWWKPSVDNKGFISWSLQKVTAEGIEIIINGPDGDKGIKGDSGHNAIFSEVFDNPYIVEYDVSLLGNIVHFSNINNPNQLYFCKNLIILDNDFSVIFKRFQAKKYAKIHGNRFKLLYCVENGYFYTWDDNISSYVINYNFSFEDKFKINTFVYDVFLDNFLYIQSNKKFIGV